MPYQGFTTDFFRPILFPHPLPFSPSHSLSLILYQLWYRRVFRQQGLVDSLLICWSGRGGGESEMGGEQEKPPPGQ